MVTVKNHLISSLACCVASLGSCYAATTKPIGENGGVKKHVKIVKSHKASQCKNKPAQQAKKAQVKKQSFGLNRHEFVRDEASLRLDKLADSRKEEIRDLIGQGRFSEAAAALRNAKDEDPGKAHKWSILESDCAILSGNGAAVAQSLSGNNQLTSGEILRYGLGLAIDGQLKKSIALEPFRHYMRFTLSPAEDNIFDISSKEGLSASWCLCIAIYEKNNHNDLLALRYFELALKYSPNNSVIRLYCALHLSKLGRRSEATEMLKSSLDGLRPALRSKALVILKDYQKAELERKLKASDNNPF